MEALEEEVDQSSSLVRSEICLDLDWNLSLPMASEKMVRHRKKRMKDWKTTSWRTKRRRHTERRHESLDGVSLRQQDSRCS